MLLDVATEMVYDVLSRKGLQTSVRNIQ